MNQQHWCLRLTCALLCPRAIACSNALVRCRCVLIVCAAASFDTNCRACLACLSTCCCSPAATCRISDDLGTDPAEQFSRAHSNYTTVVSQYNRRMKDTPVCVRNSTWLRGINDSISSILAPPPNNNGTNNTLLCPQTCLNLGSFATLFKLSQNCICDQEQLFSLQRHSAVVSTDAGVALAGSMLIYLACCCLHGYLVSQYVHAGYEYDEALKQWNEEQWRRRRRKHAHGSHSSIAARAASAAQQYSSHKRSPGSGGHGSSGGGLAATASGGHSSTVSSVGLGGDASLATTSLDVIRNGLMDEEMGGGSCRLHSDKGADVGASKDDCRLPLGILGCPAASRMGCTAPTAAQSMLLLQLLLLG